jgi:hypothetical protein
MNLERLAPGQAVIVTGKVYGKEWKFICFTYRYLIFLDYQLKFAGDFMAALTLAAAGPSRLR